MIRSRRGCERGDSAQLTELGFESEAKHKHNRKELLLYHFSAVLQYFNCNRSLSSTILSFSCDFAEVIAFECKAALALAVPGPV